MASKSRKAVIKRKTRETDISIKLNVDGRGVCKVDTGIPFLNHMLELFTKHGLFDCDIRAKGDLDVDIHHTNEDVGIALGQAFEKALGNKTGIRRYGFFSLPMDETLIRVSLDISGRPSVHVKKDREVRFSRLENYSFHDAVHFMTSFCQHAGINMHIELERGQDQHHIIEGMFKGVARALDAATMIDPRVKGVPSTKGTL